MTGNINLKEYIENYWQMVLSENKTIIMFGAGRQAERIAPLLAGGMTPAAFCDNNTSLIGGTFMWGETAVPIISYSEAKEKFNDYIIIISTMISSALEIRDQLIKEGEKNPIYHMNDPFKIDDEFLSYDKKYEKYTEWFADEESKNIYLDFLKYKMTGSAFGIADSLSGSTFFDDSIIPRRNDHIYIDVGAFTGDTICKFLQFSGGSYKKIVGFEADEGNARSAKAFIEYGCIQDAEIINKGCWSEKTTLKFNTLSNKNSINYGSPNFFRKVDLDIDRKMECKGKREKLVSVVEELEVDSLDNTVSELHPTLIKINALASDYPVLQGAEKIIKRDRPSLILEFGVRPAYISDTLELLKGSVSEYKFYLRVKRISLGAQGSDLKVVLYAIC